MNYKRLESFQGITIRPHYVLIYNAKTAESIKGQILHLRVNQYFAVLRMQTAQMDVLAVIFSAQNNQIDYHKLHLMRCYWVLGG